MCMSKYCHSLLNSKKQWDNNKSAGAYREHTLECSLGIFYGVAQKDCSTCGARGILNLSKDLKIKFRVGLGSNKNNYVELSALWLLLGLEKEKNICGDSMLIIKW